MSLLARARRLTGAAFVFFGVIVAFSGVLIAATNRAGAASIIEAVSNAITCSSTGTASCLSGTNSSSGVGVYGTSKDGTGLRGLSTSNYGLKATSSSGEGVFGQSATGAAGVAGTMTSGIGVIGYTTGSSAGTGVFGQTNGTGSGVAGYSASGPGVQGTSVNSSALVALGQNAGTGVDIATNTGYGIVAQTNGSTAIYGRNTNGPGADISGSYLGVIGRAPSEDGYPIVATDLENNDVFYVDGHGDVFYSGSLQTTARTQGGASATAYGSKSAAPTIEDSGTAQLLGGASVVRLDPTFAATIDPTKSYRVFITPGGDSRGLYVANKTAAGFIVRESQGGRSSLSFDWRIIASPVGHARERMAMVGRDVSAGGPHIPNPVVHSRALAELLALKHR